MILYKMMRYIYKRGTYDPLYAFGLFAALVTFVVSFMCYITIALGVWSPYDAGTRTPESPETIELNRVEYDESPAN